MGVSAMQLGACLCVCCTSHDQKRVCTLSMLAACIVHNCIIGVEHHSHGAHVRVCIRRIATYGDDVIGCGSQTSRRIDIGDGIVYTLYASPMLTWEEADYVCKARGTSLVKITSKDQNDRLQASVMDASLGVTPDSFLGHFYTAFWLGLSDRAKEGTYVWTSDGTGVSFSPPWAAGAPDNGGDVEHCIFVLRTDGTWNDISCTYRAAYVCA